MKRETMLIIAIVVSSLLLISIDSVVAIDEYETITDVDGDVSDLSTGELVVEHADIDVDDIDILEGTYSRDGQIATLTLKVLGDINDRGDIVDLDIGTGDDFDIDTIAYTFELVTSEDIYSISYVNEKCQVMYSDFEKENLSSSDFSVQGGILTISFNLKSSDETYESLTAATFYMKINFSMEDLDELDDIEELFTYIGDVAPNPPLEVFVYATNLGVVGSLVQFNGTAVPLTGQPPYQYHWDFGDDTTSEEQNPTHAYNKAGKYTYVLTVTDASDGTANDTGSINIAGGDDNEEDGGGTPGFEFVIVVVAIVVLLLRRKR